MKLEVRNLNTFFEDTQILKNVNMDVVKIRFIRLR